MKWRWSWPRTGKRAHVWGCDQRIVVMTDAGTVFDASCAALKAQTDVRPLDERLGCISVIDLRSPEATGNREERRGGSTPQAPEA